MSTPAQAKIINIVTSTPRIPSPATTDMNTERWEHDLFEEKSKDGPRTNPRRRADIYGTNSSGETLAFPRVVLENLHWKLTEVDITNLLRKFSPVKVKLFFDKTDRSLGVAEAYFRSYSDAEAARNALNGTVVETMTIIAHETEVENSKAKVAALRDEIIPPDRLIRGSFRGLGEAARRNGQSSLRDHAMRAPIHRGTHSSLGNRMRGTASRSPSRSRSRSPRRLRYSSASRMVERRPVPYERRSAPYRRKENHNAAHRRRDRSPRSNHSSRRQNLSAEQLDMEMEEYMKERKGKTD